MMGRAPTPSSLLTAVLASLRLTKNHGGVIDNAGNNGNACNTGGNGDSATGNPSLDMTVKLVQQAAAQHTSQVTCTTTVRISATVTNTPASDTFLSELD